MTDVVVPSVGATYDEIWKAIRLTSSDIVLVSSPDMKWTNSTTMTKLKEIKITRGKGRLRVYFELSTNVTLTGVFAR